MKRSLALISAMSMLAFTSCSAQFNTDGGISFGNTSSRSENLVIPAQGVEKLDIDVEVGDIDIVSSDTSEISLKLSYKVMAVTKKTADELVEDIQVKHDVEDGTVYVRFEYPEIDKKKFNTPAIDMEIVVPRDFCSYDINADVGDIDIRKLTGSINIVTNVGDIDMNDVTLTGDSSINANVGDVDISFRDIESCNFNITTNVGDVDIDTNGMSWKDVTEGKNVIRNNLTAIVSDKCTIVAKTNAGEVKSNRQPLHRSKK